MTIKELVSELELIPHNKVKIAIADIDGVLRGKILHKTKFIEVLTGSLGFCDVIFGWDLADACYTNTHFTGWHTGYPDTEIVLDPQTSRKIPWEDGMPFFLGQLATPADGICPRSLLRNIAKQAEEQGYFPAFAQEYEWFNFRETSSSIESRQSQNLQTLTPGMFGYSLLRLAENSPFFYSLFDNMEQFGVPLEGMHTETGPGVFEAAIQYDAVLLAADRACLFKAAVKELANKQGITASFMAKWNSQLPGCGGHIHQSLWDKGQRVNLFYDRNAENNMSSLFRSYLAGQLHCLPYLMPMYAPVVNSYKRLVRGAWAPTHATWGLDNRTAAFRVIHKNAKACRVENRIPGADVNPYLAMAASLASGLYGIRHGLSLSDSPLNGSAYEHGSDKALPPDLGQAIRAMKESGIAVELFGESFVNHFIATREWEWNQFQSRVTDWEIKRYFEII